MTRPLTFSAWQLKYLLQVAIQPMTFQQHPLYESFHPLLHLLFDLKHLGRHHTTRDTMPYISTEALVGAALLVVVALGYQYIPISTTGESSSGGSKSSKKKNKKKSKATGASSGEATSANGDSTTAITSALTEKPSIKQNGGAEQAESSSSSKAEPKTKPKTLAQKIAPQPRKTKVDE